LLATAHTIQVIRNTSFDDASGLTVDAVAKSHLVNTSVCAGFASVSTMYSVSNAE
jgi:hypothetical protein